tara:strand:+ start:2158 stop:3027 length:870 start_codon:yes stop_codon:yes gene_type:complete
MGKKSPEAPAAPDPAKTAAAQAAANKEAAISQANINMVNQYTPYGALEYTQRGTAEDGTPQYAATQTLSDDQQKLFDLSNQAQRQYGEIANQQLGMVGDRLSDPLDFGSLGAAPVANEDYRNLVAQAQFDRINPQLEMDRERLRTQLVNQGFQQGTAAYDDAMSDFDRSRNDMRLAIDASAGEEMARMYALENASRNQAISEMLQERSVPLNETAALISGTQVQNPAFVNTPTQSIAAAPIAESIYGSYNGLLNQYAADRAARSAETAGLYGLLGTGALAGAYGWGGRR